VTPATTTTYTVVGTSVNGCTNSASITVNVLPSPTVSVTQAPEVRRCLLDSPSQLNATGGVSYLWQPGALTGGSVFVSPATTTTYTVTGTASNGCTNSAQVLVTVNVNPTVTITPAAPSRCALDAPTTITGNGANTYQWVGGPATANYDVSPTVTTDYIVVGTDAQVPACTNTASVTVSVRPNPAAPTAATVTSPACPGQNGAVYSVQPVAGVTYTWTLPAEAVSFTGQGTSQISVNWSPTAVLQGNPPIVVNITVRATLNGCNSATDLTMPVTISSPPPAQPQNPTGPSPVCRFTTQTYSVDPVPTASSYDWTNLPAGAFITTGLGTNSVGINWGTAAAGTYTINVAARNFCGVGPTQSIVVTLEQAPGQPGTITVPSPLCVGQNAAFSIAPVAGAASYEWVSSCGWPPVGPATADNVIFTPSTGGPCLLSVRSVNACGVSSYRTAVLNPSDVPAQPGPMNGLVRVCTGSVQTYSVQSAPGVTYAWTGVPAGATVVGPSNTNQITIDWGTAAPGNYTLDVEPSNACGVGTSRTLTVEVVGDPPAPAGVFGPVTICRGGTGTFFVAPEPNVTYNWSVNPTTGVVLNSSANNAEVLFQTVGLYTLSVTLQNECATSAPAQLGVNIVAPSTVSATVDQTVCASNPNISASATPAGGTWTCVSCPGGAAITAGGLVSGLSVPGERYVFSYSYSDGTCPPVSVETSVLYGVAQGGAVGASATVCSGANGLLQLTGHVGEVVRWERSSDCLNYSPIQNQTAGFTYVNLTATTCFRAVVLNGAACPEAFSSPATVTVIDRVQASSVPSVVGTCTDVVTLTGNTAAGYTGSWAYLSGAQPSVSLTNLAGGIANVSGLTTPGTYIFRYTLTNATCGTTTTDVVVNRAPAVTAANAGLDRTICAANATLTGNRPLVGTGTWSYVGGTASATPSVQTLSNQFGVVTGMTAPGSYIFEWRIVSPACPASPSSDQVTVIVEESPTVADAGADQTRCASDALLTGNAPLVGASSWHFTSGPSVPVLTPFGNSVNVTGMNAPGVYVFEYRIVNGSCPPSVDQVRVTVVAPPSAAVVPKLEYRICESQGVVLRANAPTVGVGQWTFVGSPTGATPTVTTSGSDGFVSGLTAYGSYDFAWTVSNAPCAAASTVQVTVIREAQAPGPVTASPNQKACLNVYPVTVTGSPVPAGYVGEWVYVSGPVSNTTVTTTGTSGNITNLDQPGFYVFEWRISGPSGSVCPARSAATVVEVEAAPTAANAGPDQTLCGDRTVLVGNVPAVGSGAWSVRPPVPAGSNPTIVGSGPTVDAISLTVSGVYVFRYTVAAGSGCPASFDEMTVTVSVPSAGGNASADATHCVGSASGSLSLSGQTGTILRWESSAANFAPGSISVFPGTASINYTNLTTTTQYRAVVRNGSCPEALSNLVTVTVNQLPTVANAGPDRFYCGSGGSVLLSGNVPTVGAGSWQQVGGPAVQVFSQGSNALVTGLTQAATYSFAYRITSGNCPPSIDVADVVVAPSSVGGFVSASATVCSGANGGTLSVFGNTGSVVRWESTTSSFTPGNITAHPGGPTHSYVNLTATTRFRAVVQSGTCPEAVSGEVLITVSQPPTAANAGADVQFCGAPSTVALTGNAPTVGTGAWVLVSQPTGGAASITGSGPNAALVNPTAEGVYVAEYRITNAPCPVSADQKLVEVFNGSNGGTVTASATVCTGANGALNLSGHKGSVIRWESSENNFVLGSITTIVNSLTTYTFNNITATTQFRAVVKAGACAEAASVPATIAVQPPPTVSNAGANQTACGSTVTLSGNVPSVGSGLWTYVTGPVSSGSLIFTPTPPNSSITTVSGLSAVGVYVFRWTISNPPCGTSQSDVVITRLNDTPVANAGPDRLICTTSTTLTGNAPTPGAGAWTYVAGPSDPLIVSVSTSPTGLGTVSGLLEAGDHVFRYTITNAPCPSTNDEMTLRVTKPVVPPTVPASVVRVCAQSVATVTADVPPFGTGVWSFVSSTNGDGASITTGGPSGTIGDVTGMDMPGEYRFRFTVSNPPCSGSSSVDVRVFRDAAPSGVAFAGADQQLCDQSNTLLVGNAPPAGVTPAWEVVSFPPLANPQVIGFGQFGSVVDMTEQGQYCFRYLYQTNTSCAGSADLVCVQVWDRPTVANAGPSGPVCTNQVTLTGNVPTVGTGTWSFVTGPTGSTPTVQTPTTNVSTMTGMNVSGAYVFRWTISNGACTPSAFDVTVNVSEGTLGGTVTGAATVCSGSNSGSLSLTGSRGSVIEWQRSTDGFAGNVVAIANTGLTQPYSNLTVTTCYRARVKDGACAEAFSSVECVTVLGAPTASNAGPAQNVCGTSTTLAANAPTSGTGMWSVIAAPAGSSPAFASVNAPNSFVSGLTAAGDYLFRWTISNAPCGVSESSVLVKVTPSVSGGAVSGSTTACSGSNSGVLTLGGSVGQVIRWERSTDVNFTAPLPIANTGLSQGYSNLTQTTWFRAVIGGGGCPETFSAPAEVSVSAPVSANAGSDQSVCSTSATVQGNAVSGYSGMWTIVTRPAAGGSTTVSTDAPTGTGTLNALVSGAYVLRWTLSGGPCGSSFDDLVLSVGTGLGGGSVGGSATVCSGTNVGTLTATGFSGAVVRWESATDPGFTQNFVNHNNPTSSFTFFNLTATRFYRAVINGGGSCGTYEIGPATVTVVGPAANVTAGGSQTVCESTVTLSGSAPVNGGVPSWTYVLGPEAPGNVIVANGGNGSATVAGLNALGNYLFRYSVDYGPCGVRTADVLVTRQATVNAGSASGSTTVCSGSNGGTVTVSGNNQPVIRWESSTDAAFSSPTPIPFTGSTLTWSNLSATTWFRAVVQGPHCGPRFSSPATVTVDQPSAGGATSGAATVCSGSNSGSLTLSGQTGSVVRWESATDAAFTQNLTPLSNATPQNYLNLTAATWYRAFVKNGVCPEAFSSSVKVTVSGPSVGGTVSGDLQVCSGVGSTTLTAVGFGCSVIRWESSADGFATVTTLNNPNSVLIVGNQTSARSYRAVSQCSPCGEAFSAPVVVTVDQPSAGGSLSGPATVCPAPNSGAITLSGAVGSVVRWETADNPAFAGLTTLANLTATQPFTNLTSTAYYRAVVRNGSCGEAFSTVHEVVVNPTVSGGVVSGSTTVCSGSNGGSLLLTGASGTVVRWETSPVSDFSANVTTISNTTASQSYSNLSSTAFYRAVVGSGACPSVFSTVASVVVDAPSSAGSVSGASSSCVTAASGSLTLSGQTGVLVRWERATDAGFTQNLTTLPGTNPLSYTESSTAFYRAVVVNGSCPAAFGSGVQIRVDQAPSGGFVSSAGPVCSGVNSGSVSLSGHFGTVVRWESATDAGFTQNFTTISNFTVSQAFTNLGQTTFYRAVVQNGACAAAFSSAGLVQVTTAPSLTASAVVVCDGSGSIIARASGGSAPYQYVLNPNNVSSSTGDFIGVSPGAYQVSVVDGAGCTALQPVFVGANPTPLVVSSVQSVTQNSAVVTWPSANSATAVYALRYRVKGSTDWTVLSNLTTTFRLLTGLQNNTVYEVQVDYRCSPATDPVGFGPIREFTTQSMGLCSQSPPNPVPVPGGVFVNQITANSARVNWNMVPDAAGYIVSWGVAGTNSNGWPQAVVCNPTTQFTLSGLAASIGYEVRVRTNCTNCTTASQSLDKRSDWSPVAPFTTLSFREVSASGAASALAVEVYPNPNRGRFTVRLSGAESSDALIEVLDASGRRVLSRSVSSDETLVELEGVSSGLYLLRVRSGGSERTAKLIVE